MMCVASVLFALTLVALYEAFFDSSFLELLGQVAYVILYVLLTPAVFVWREVRLVFKGITQEQYRELILTSGVETCRLIGRIYYAYDPFGSRFTARHFFLRVRKEKWTTL